MRATTQPEYVDTARALTAASAVYHYVHRNGVFTGRRFTSLTSAERYASSIDGEVRTTD